MSENLGRLTSAGVPIQWGDKEYILGKFSFRDRGLIENALVREKRRRKLQVIIDLQDVLPPDEYEKRFEQARREAEMIGNVSESEVEAFLNTDSGIVMLLWVLFEDRYPREFTRDDIVRMIVSGAIGESEMIAILTQMRDALGVGPAGNSTGHNPTTEALSKPRRRSRKRRR